MCQTVDKRVKICRELREERDEDEGFKGEWECGKLKRKKARCEREHCFDREKNGWAET